MADVSSYKKDIQEAPNGERAKAYVVDAFEAINADGPSALTFYGLKEDAYVKRATYHTQVVGGVDQLVPISMETNTLEYRMNQLILKVKKTDEPADSKWIPDEPSRKSQADMFLTSKGVRKIIGALNNWPGV